MLFTFSRVLLGPRLEPFASVNRIFTDQKLVFIHQIFVGDWNGRLGLLRTA